MITEPGIYDLDAATYHADKLMDVPTLSSSIAKVIIAQTPMHAAHEHPRLNPHYEPDDNTKFDFGNAMHAALLGGTRLTLIPFEDYRTKAAQQMRDAALARGVVPVKQAEFDRVQTACGQVWQHLREHKQAATAIQAGKPEQTLVWREGGIWCRCKLDWLPVILEHLHPLKAPVEFYDLKTTTDANPEQFSRRIFDLGHDMQCAFYRRGIRAVLGIENPVFRFVVVEAKPPHGVSVCQLSPSALDLAERKVEEAIATWGRCMAANKWPGYPPYVHHVDAPSWHAQRFEDRAIRREQIADHEQTILGAG